MTTLNSLGDICKFRYGKSLPEASRLGGTVPVFGSNGRVGFHNQSLTSGPTIVIGRKGSFGEVNYSADACWPIDTTYFVDQASTSADLRWLYHLLRTLGLNRLNRAAAVPGLNREDAYRKQVGVPPLDEQRRIAAMLDKAEELRAKRRAAIALLDQLPQAIFLEMFGDPISNPLGWPGNTLGDVAEFVGGGTPSRACSEFFTGSICWATSKDMKGEVLSETEEHITEEAIRKSATKLVPPGTILIVVKSKILAHRLPVTVSEVPVCFGQDLKGIVPKRVCTQTYIFYSLKVAQRWLLDQARGVNTEGLTLDHLRRFPLPLPPEPLRQRFTNEVKKVDELRCDARSASIAADQLFATLQHRAFAGKL